MCFLPERISRVLIEEDVGLRHGSELMVLW
jgi:hypothetical protein